MSAGFFYVKKLSKENRVAETYSTYLSVIIIRNALLILFRGVGFYGYTKAVADNCFLRCFYLWL